MIGERQGLIVWLHNIKLAKNLRKYGNIHYISKRLKYVVLYCNMDESETVMNKIKNLSFVKMVEPSYRPFLKTDFDNAKPDKAKEYDYKIGF
ncbi:YlbG family protein [Bacillus andreraoultii]|uniref:YlbG family protein n=1 Tax=Bacillus andreraoultii TaxID=1499685 RepID=UPI00053A164C|nr:YlbG family protein [Bacillus andreraoultii]